MTKWIDNSNDFVSYVSIFSRIFLIVGQESPIDFEHFFTLKLNIGYMILE